MTRQRLAFFLTTLAFLSGGANAQTPTSPTYDVQEMNFDMWCQEEQHLPPARCDKRLPDDDAAFQAYRAKIEAYEIPYLQQKNDEQTLNRAIIHYDPVDNSQPTDPSPVPDKPNNSPPGG